jgi:hypothetical protein
MNLDRIQVVRKTGSERFHFDDPDINVSLREFWQWSVSDLVSNATRGRLAEFIVAMALAVDTSGVRDEWAAFDLITPEGTKVEVKSAAFLQTWFQARLSSITFSTRTSRAWDASTNTFSPESTRQADVYVFALLHHTDKKTVDPMNVNHWCFYPVATSKLDVRNKSQGSITLKALKALCGEGVAYENLREAVQKQRHPSMSTESRVDGWWHLR